MQIHQWPANYNLMALPTPREQVQSIMFGTRALFSVEGEQVRKQTRRIVVLSHEGMPTNGSVRFQRREQTNAIQTGRSSGRASLYYFWNL